MNLFSRFASRLRTPNPFAVAAPVTAAAAPPATAATKPRDPDPALTNALMGVIRPEARLAWMATSVRNYTPEYIEMVLRLGLAGDLQMQHQLFHMMEDTWPRLNKNLLELKRAVQSLDRGVVPFAKRGAKPTPEAQLRADLVNDVLFSMRPTAGADENGFSQTVFDLMDAWAKGVSVLEIDWRVDDAEGRIAPRATRWVHPTFYGYSATGGRLGLHDAPGSVSIPPGTPKIDGSLHEFPPDKFLLATCKARSTVVPAGALLRPLAFWWAASNFTAEWLLNFAQIFGMPIRWASYDPNNPSLLPIIEQMLEQMGSSGWAAFPAGTALELKEASKSGADNPQAYVRDLSDRICDILILGQTLTTDVGASGSRALGDVHKSVRDQIVESAGAWIDEIINLQFIPAILRLNFGDEEESPKLMSNLREVQDAKVMADRDAVLLGQGVVLPKKWFYQRHDIPEPAPDEEVIVGKPPAAPGGMAKDEGPDPKEDVKGSAAVQARQAQEKLAAAVMEDLTGVEARWLGGVKPFFLRLVAAAQSKNVSDEDFEKTLEKARTQMPDLFKALDVAHLEDAMTKAMGAAAVNGAVDGYLQRKAKKP